MGESSIEIFETKKVVYVSSIVHASNELTWAKYSYYNAIATIQNTDILFRYRLPHAGPRQRWPRDLYHEADSRFAGKKIKCGTALVVLLETHSEIFLGQLALNFDVPFKRLLWSVSYIFIKFAVGHVHCDIWGMRNNLRAWTEHYPVTGNLNSLPLRYWLVHYTLYTVIDKFLREIDLWSQAQVE